MNISKIHTVNFKIILSLLLLIVTILYSNSIHCQNLKDKKVSEYVWDLSTIYTNYQAWRIDKEKIEHNLISIGDLNSNIKSKKELLVLLKETTDLRIRVGKMSVYGFLVSTVNETSEDATKQKRIGNSLEARVEEAVAFLPELILEINKDSLNKWINLPEFDKYKRYVLDVVENRNHFLQGISSKINNSLIRWGHQSSETYEELGESGIKWPKMEDSTEINFGNYRSLFSMDNELNRKKNLSNFYNRLEDFENVYGHLLIKRIEANHAIAINENYKNGVDAIFSKRDGYSDNIYKSMIKVTKDSLHTFHELLELMLDFSESKNPSYSDLYYSRSKFNLKSSYPIDESLTRAISLLSPLGSDYSERLKRRISDDRLHLALLPEKSPSTFAVYPSVGGMKSFMVMPYYGSYATSSALTGGLALMMAYSDMPKERPFLNRYDPPIYSNALIYAGRIIHDDYMANSASSLHEKIAMKMNSLFNAWRSYFNYVIFSEFEYTLQELVAKGEKPSGSEISTIYLDLLRDYYGHNTVMDIPDYLATNWITYALTFSSYEQMFWPPSYALGIHMASGLSNKNRDVHELFSGVLGNSHTDKTIHLLGNTGIDLESEKSYKLVMEKVKTLVLEVKKLQSLN